MKPNEPKPPIEQWLDKWGANIDWEAKKELRAIGAENERLKRQLEKVLEILDSMGGETCPNDFGLKETKCDLPCSNCWRKALEEVK